MLVKAYLNRFCKCEREAALPYYLCEWMGATNDVENLTVFNDDGSLNSDFLTARQITVWRSIFSPTEAGVKELDEKLKGVYKFTQDADGVASKPIATGITPSQATPTLLIVVNIPLKELNTNVNSYYLLDRNGNKLTRTFVRVVGVANSKTNEWAEPITRKEMAQAELDRNLTNGKFVKVS